MRSVSLLIRSYGVLRTRADNLYGVILCCARMHVCGHAAHVHNFFMADMVQLCCSLYVLSYRCVNDLIFTSLAL